MVPFSSVYEEDRLREVLGKIIEEEELPRFNAFSNEPSSKKKKNISKSELAIKKIIIPSHIIICTYVIYYAGLKICSYEIPILQYVWLRV